MSGIAHILNMFTSPGHNFAGHHGREPDSHATESREQIVCVEGKGIEGDRYFNHKENYKGQITFFDFAVYTRMREELNVPECKPDAFRRNIIVQDLPLADLIGKRFRLQGVEFEGVEECRPCYWMDHAVGEGAEDFLKGQGGLRARILSSGTLSLGTAEYAVLEDTPSEEGL